MRETTSTRDRLLEAAIQVAGRDGILALTLDNVAREAGVSKGGVTHHFAGKDALIEAMFEFFGQRAEQMLFERIAHDPQHKMRWARALVSSLFPKEAAAFSPAAEVGTPSQPWSAETMRNFVLAAIAAAINHRGQVGPLKQFGDRMRQRLMSDGDGFEQLLVWLAIDGLMLWQFVGLIDNGSPDMKRIAKELAKRVSGGKESSGRRAKKTKARARVSATSTKRRARHAD
jgi:AcrR family transcriptional regulator